MTKARDIASAIPAPSTVSSAELGFLDGVTSAIQTQIDTKAASSTAATLTGTQTLTNKTLTSPVLTTPSISTITTKGDLLGFDTALNRVPIGANNTVLTADSAQALGLKWATPTATPPNSGFNFVATSQITTSTSYTDLTTVQAVTVTTGTKAIVFLAANITNGNTSRLSKMSFSVSSGGIAADDARSISYKIEAGVDFQNMGGHAYVTGLTAGSNTFTAKFACNISSDATFKNRFISVIDMGS